MKPRGVSIFPKIIKLVICRAQICTQAMVEVFTRVCIHFQTPPNLIDENKHRSKEANRRNNWIN